MSDQGWFTVEFAAIHGPNLSNASCWYDLEIVERLITGTSRGTAELNSEGMAFVRRHLSGIESRFQPALVASTIEQLDDLLKARLEE